MALKDIRLQAREPGGDVLAGALERQVIESLAERFLTMFIVPRDSVGFVQNRLRGTNLWAQRLTVRFPDGDVEDGYRALLGVAAFHAHAEVQWHFLLKERLKPEAIIL